MDPASAAKAWATFFVVVISASRIGVLFPRIGLPLITGYLAVGTLVGPYVLGLIHTADLAPLSYVTQFALAFIAFSAGAELYLPELRSLFKSIMSQTTAIFVVTMVVMTPLVYAIGSAGVAPFMADLESACTLSVASIAAAIMVTQSPASNIAIVKELRAKGVFTSTLLGITVMCDVFVLLGFAFTTSLAESSCSHHGFSVAALGITIALVLCSLGIGVGVGKLLIVLMWFKRVPTRYLILPLGLAIFVACDRLTAYSHDNLPYIINFDALLICISAGYVCTNQSKNRHRFIGVLQQAGPYVFLPFFTLTGASLDLSVMLQAIGFAAIVVIVRAVCLFVGAYAGGWFAKQESRYNLIMWTTLVTQAGVSLGLASEVGATFPEWGRPFQTNIIACVLVNQIAGPILFKLGVRKAGEDGKGSAGSGLDADSVIPTALILGSGPSALSLSTRLLRDHWKVIMVTATPVEATRAAVIVSEYAAATRAAEEAHHESEATIVTQALDAVKAGRNMSVRAVKEVVSAAHAVATGGRESGVSFGKTKAERSAVPVAPVSSPLAAQDACVVDTEGHIGVPTAVAATPSHGAEHAEPEEAPIETRFSAVALIDDDGHSAASAAVGPNPFLPTPESDAAALAAVCSALAAASATRNGAMSGVSSSGTDPRYATVVAQLFAEPSLQAVASLLPSDAANFVALRVVDAAIAGAPRSSPLHGVRLLTELRHPAWAPVFGLLGATPLHAPASTTLVAARLLTARCSSSAPPVQLLPSQPNSAALTAATISEVSEGPPQWAIWAEGDGGNTSVLRRRLRPSGQSQATFGEAGAASADIATSASSGGSPPPAHLLALLRAEAAAATAKAKTATHGVPSTQAPTVPGDARSTGVAVVVSADTIGSASLRALAAEATGAGAVVPDWEREAYLDELGTSHTEASSEWDSRLEHGFVGGRADGKGAQERGALNMYGSVIAQSDHDAEAA